MSAAKLLAAARAVVDARFKRNDWESLKDSIAHLAACCDEEGGTPSPVVGMSDGELIARAILVHCDNALAGAEKPSSWFGALKAELDRRAEAMKGGGK